MINREREKRLAASISKEGSRRAKYLMLTQGGSDTKEQFRASMFCNWNE